jgi:hypothetical protein
MPVPSDTRQPWPMKWVVLVIILCIGVYTVLTLRYRRPERAFQPFQDLRDRANTHRLIDAGFQRIPLTAELPADALSADPGARASSAAAGLPVALRETLVVQPQLPAEILTVSAAPSVNAMFAYPIAFRCTLPDNKQQLAGAQLYVRGSELVVAPDFERITGSLLARTRENLIRLTVPAGALKPGSYHVTLVGARASKTWTLQVH